MFCLYDNINASCVKYVYFFAVFFICFFIFCLETSVVCYFDVGIYILLGVIINTQTVIAIYEKHDG